MLIGNSEQRAFCAGIFFWLTDLVEDFVVHRTSSLLLGFRTIQSKGVVYRGVGEPEKTAFGKCGFVGSQRDSTVQLIMPPIGAQHICPRQ